MRRHSRHSQKSWNKFKGWLKPVLRWSEYSKVFNSKNQSNRFAFHPYRTPWNGHVYKGNSEMDRMIEQQIFALEMDALTNRLQRLQLDNKIVTLLNELWDKMNKGGCHKVEITSDEDGMEVIIGELMVPTFYFTNEKKFSSQLCCILKSALQNEHWLRAKIHQLFVTEWKSDYFSHTRWNRNDTFTFNQ